MIKFEEARFPGTIVTSTYWRQKTRNKIIRNKFKQQPKYYIIRKTY